ncbi:MAG TPA: PepSY domain-containing protein, partial [Nocardioides sp.]
IFMCIAGPIMWWRRRPKGSRTVAAPRGRLDLKTGPMAVVGLVLLGVALPLFGASLVAIFVLDQIILRRVGPLKNFFNTV